MQHLQAVVIKRLNAFGLKSNGTNLIWVLFHILYKVLVQVNIRKGGRMCFRLCICYSCPKLWCHCMSTLPCHHPYGFAPALPKCLPWAWTLAWNNPILWLLRGLRMWVVVSGCKIDVKMRWVHLYIAFTHAFTHLPRSLFLQKQKTIQNQYNTEYKKTIQKQ